MARTSNRRASLLGMIIGAICGLGGVAAGLYAGVIEPLRSSGGADKLPVPVLMTSIILSALFVLYLGYLLLAHLRKKKNTPSDW